MDDSKAKVDVPYRIVYEVRWEGEADSFVVVPADVESVEWAATRTVEMTTRAEENVFVVAQTVEYVPFTSGEYEVPVFNIGYFDPALIREEAPAEGEKAEQILPDPQFLEASAFSVNVRPELGPYVMYGSILALLACFAVFGVRNSRKRKMSAMAGQMAVPIPETVPAVLNLARQYRLDGKFYEFYKELARGAGMLAPSSGGRELRAKLEADAKEIGYRGARPTDDEMDGVVRDLERALRADTREVD